VEEFLLFSLVWVRRLTHLARRVGSADWSEFDSSESDTTHPRRRDAETQRRRDSETQRLRAAFLAEKRGKAPVTVSRIMLPPMNVKRSKQSKEMPLWRP